MTQDLSVQNKKPSVLPYAIGGAAVGTAAGWGASKLGFTQAAKYTSWEDILKESADGFEKMTKAAGENETLKKGVEASKEAYNTFANTVKGFANDVRASFTAESKAVTDAMTARKETFNKAVTDISKKITDGKIKIDGFDAAGKSTDEIAKKAKEYIKKNLDADDLKPLKEAMSKVAETRKALAGKVNGSEKMTEAAKTAWEAVKDKVNGFKEPRTKALLIGGAVVGLLLGALLRPKAKEQV